ncbi:MAG: hypothetical protein WCN95_11045 [bacterium]
MKHMAVSVCVLLTLGVVAGPACGEDEGITNATTWQMVKEGSKHAFVIGKIKAAYADRKDIAGRYIRVRFDGHVLQLAGFVKNKENAKAAEEIAQSIAKAETVQTFWAFDEAIDNREPYKTHAGEQTEDGILWAKVMASLNSPDVQPQLKNAEIHLVNVNHGSVTVYIIADAPPDEFNLEPHVKPIPGVIQFSCKTAKTYTPVAN